MTKKRIIVAHPEKQHSYRLVEAISDMGMLDEYITTVYYKKRNITRWIDGITKGRIRLKEIRKMPFITDEKVKQFCELKGLMLLVLRHTALKKLTNRMQNFNFDIFGKKVALEAVKRKADVVIMYDTNSLECFNKLKNTNIIRIMDTSIANREYTKHIYESVIKCKTDWDNFSEKEILLNKKEMKRLRDEIKQTDYFLVPSQFVKKSLQFSGVAAEKIRIVPYGVDAKLFQFSERRKDISSGVMELLFVGQCSYRKGINYLLEAVDKLPEMVNLTIVGSYMGIPDLYEKYKQSQNIKFLGRIQHDKLPDVYSKADIFVLPSLSEGMSLVGLEAMAAGLPLLCSQNCGVNDVVIENENGWILEEISTNSIIQSLNYINSIRHRIPEMGIRARKTAEQYSWDYYKNNMQKAILQILGEL